MKAKGSGCLQKGLGKKRVILHFGGEEPLKPSPASFPIGRTEAGREKVGGEGGGKLSWFEQVTLNLPSL